MNITSAQFAYIVAFGLAAVVSFATVGWVHDRYDARGTRPFVYTFAVVGTSALVAATHVAAAASRPVTEVATALELALPAAAAVGWLWFAARYTDHWLCDHRPAKAVVAGFLLVAVVVPLTNPLHGLVYPAFELAATPFVHYEPVKGPLHYAITVASYVPFVVGTGLLVRLLYDTRYLSRAILSLLFGAAALAGANALPYLVTVPIDHNPLYMPLGATLAGIGAAAALNYDLFTVTPVARRTVVTAIRDPILTVDKTGRVVDVNPAFVETFTDAEAGEAVVYEPVETVAPVVAGAVTEAVERERAEEGVLEVTDERDDRRYTLSVSPVESGAHLLGHTLVFRDVTEAVRSRRELERQNEQLDEFARTAAHNLRNPLGAVSGFTDVLGSHLEAVEEGRAEYDHTLVSESLAQVTRHAERMDGIVGDFLRVMRDSKTVTSFEPVDVVAAVESARSLLEDDPLRVTVDRPGVVYGDRLRVAILLRSVFQSSLDRVDEGEPVEVRVRVTDDGLELTDDAGSIPPGDCEMLLEHGQTSHYEVTGLGLVVARTLAQVHHWEVEAEPHADGVRVRVTGAETAVEPGADDPDALDHPGPPHPDDPGGRR
ncbi:PAS domain-containing protein [Salinirubellus salinus]|uniref:histidine kinase n=1 Tax=Salinirubellus salinus TaxID=1364945 RepID=A0A9E7UA87_9EURY|nr:histidine kinase N-terminal 7TM domain-containing protein [Salinirubellus salinus]UWM53747.1 PAS domain-containing protein [Salinirubellus salinus]